MPGIMRHTCPAIPGRHSGILTRGLTPSCPLHATHTQPDKRNAEEFRAAPSNFTGLRTQEIFFAGLQCLETGNSTLIMSHCGCDVLGDGAGRPQSEYNAPLCDSND